MLFKKGKEGILGFRQTCTHSNIYYRKLSKDVRLGTMSNPLR